MRPEQDDMDEAPRPAGPATEEDSPAHPPGSSPSVAPAGEDVAQDITELLAEAEAKRDEYLELARRTQADFENYRKRMTAEVQAANGRGKTELARELIDPVDHLELALVEKGVDLGEDPLDSTKPVDEQQDEFVRGIVFIFRGMTETLRRHGIERVDPKGQKFDPMLHEALSMKPAEGGPTGVVVEVLQKGYRLGDHLIRPARVVVST